MSEPGYWYRYEYDAAAPRKDQNDQPLWSAQCGELVLERFMVLKRTPKGAWISRWPWRSYWPQDGKRFVLATGRKRYAMPTEAEALESYIQRKRRHISILTGQLSDAKEGLERAKSLQQEHHIPG